MTPEIAKATMQFMLRVQLTGQEVPAFNAVMTALQQVQHPEPAAGGPAESASPVRGRTT